MLRATIAQWVQRCPSCQACWADLSQLPEAVRSVLGSASYASIVSNPKHPELANSFLAEAALAAEAGALSISARSTLRAAWVLDDAGDQRAARECRQLAAARLSAAIAAEVGDWPQARANRLSTRLALVDVLRRLERFDEAMNVATALEGDADSNWLRQVLWYQKQRIEAADSDRHTEDDALGWGPPNTRTESRLLDQNETVRYLWRYYRDHLTPAERMAAGASLMNFRGEPRWDVEDAAALALLAHGAEEFVRALLERLRRSTAVIINTCPKCSKLARTPAAKQCRSCGYSWRNEGRT